MHACIVLHTCVHGERHHGYMCLHARLSMSIVQTLRAQCFIQTLKRKRIRDNLFMQSTRAMHGPLGLLSELSNHQHTSIYISDMALRCLPRPL